MTTTFPRSPYEAETVERYVDADPRPRARHGRARRELPGHDVEWGVERPGEIEIAGRLLRDVMSTGQRLAYIAEAATMDPEVPSRQLSRPLSYDTDAWLRRALYPVRLAPGDVAGSVVIDAGVERLRSCCPDFEERYELAAVTASTGRRFTRPSGMTSAPSRPLFRERTRRRALTHGTVVGAGPVGDADERKADRLHGALGRPVAEPSAATRPRSSRDRSATRGRDAGPPRPGRGLSGKARRELTRWMSTV
jgi:hypothetical protein